MRGFLVTVPRGADPGDVRRLSRLLSPPQARNVERRVDRDGTEQFTFTVNEVLCDPSWLGEVLLLAFKIDPEFFSFTGRRRRSWTRPFLRCSFKVSRRANRETLGNALANISILDHEYKLEEN